jgi:hypothetical protein
MKNRVYLNFTISDYDDITHEVISQALGMNPFMVIVKGEKTNPNSTSETPILYRFNRWVMAAPLDEYCTFEDQMNATLDIIEPKIDLFKPFCEKYRCEFSCAIYLRYNNGESTPSIYLDSRYNKLIKELKIGFDIDLYNWPNEE